MQVDDPMAESLCREARRAVASEVGVREFVRSTLEEIFKDQRTNVRPRYLELHCDVT